MKRKTVEKFVKAAIAFVAICIALCTSVVLINAYDEPPLPEIERLKAQQLKSESEAKTGFKAFYYFLGLRAGAPGDDDEIESKGEDIWNQIKFLSIADQDRFKRENLQTAVWISPNFNFPKNTISYSHEWLANPALQEQFKKAVPNLKKYQHWIEYAAYDVPPSDNTPKTFFHPAASAPILILQGHRWLITDLARLAANGNWSEVQSWIRKENHFQKQLVKNGTLLQIVIAQTIIRDNQTFLVKEIEQNPKLRITPATLESFEFPTAQQLLTYALDTETLIFSQALEGFNSSEYFEYYFGDNGIWLRRSPIRMLLTPNQTLNQYYLFTREIIAKDCKEATAITNTNAPTTSCYGINKIIHPEWSIQWARNPLGRTLLKIVTSQVAGQSWMLRRKALEMQELFLKLQDKVK